MSKTLIIAEAGVNHNGDPNLALALIDAAADAGADAVKFQTFVPEALCGAEAQKAPYQANAEPGDETQLQMLQRLVLPPEDHHRLAKHCQARGIQFLSSPFDSASLNFLCHDMDLDLIKIGSGDLTNGPLLLELARLGKEVILSTGMADLTEVAEALTILGLGYADTTTAIPKRQDRSHLLAEPEIRATLQKRVRLLHCTTAYPCPLEAVNLRAMDTLSEHFGLPVGYSDHTEDIAIAVAAVARGACVIEKHLTLDPALPGPDHAASLQPERFAAMVQGIRAVEIALGDPAKQITAAEHANKAVARKGLFANKDIYQGERFTADNLIARRPATALSPMAYWDLIGRTASRAYRSGEAITADDIMEAGE